MILYRLYQDNRRTSANKGKWYAKAIHTETVGLKKLAALVQRNASVKYSDCLAVIAELVEVIQDQLQAGKRVKLDGFGAFKIGIKSAAADTAADFTAMKHIVGSRVNFQPETTIDTATRQRHKIFLDGAQFMEAPKNDVDTSAAPASGSGSGSSSGSGNSSTSDPDEEGNG